MPEISFSLILNENLKNKNLKLKQVESVIEVTGKLDPYQLQRIRDHVSDSVQARRKTINDLIAGKAKQAAQLRDRKKQEQLIAEVDTAIAKSTAAFDKKIQASISDFCKADSELEKAAESAGWKFWCTTGWKLGNLVWDGVETVNDATDLGGRVDMNLLMALKGMLDLSVSLYEFATEQRDAWRGVDDQEKRVMAALDAIRKVKKGQPIGQSLIDKAETALAPLGPKIDTLERAARKTSGTLDQLLNKQSAGVLKGRKEIKQLEMLIDSAIKEVTAIGAGVSAKREAQKRAKDSIRSAITRAKADNSAFMDWVTDQYKRLNDAVEKYEIEKPATSLGDLAKQMRILINKAIESEEG